MDQGSTTASSPETTSSFVASRLGAETSVPLLPDLVGRPESALADLAAGTPVRVLGRDGECVPARTADLNPNRINVIITAGTIVWAAHF